MSTPRPAPGGTCSTPSRMRSGSVSRSSDMSRKLDSSPARREVQLVGGAEGDRARGAELAVDLVAHHDLQAEALGQVVHPLRAGEAGAGGLDADRGGRSAEHLAGDVGRGRDRLVGDERHVESLDEPAPAEHVVGGAQLLGERAGRGRPSPSWRAATRRRSSRGCRRRTARRRRRSARAVPGTTAVSSVTGRAADLHLERR